MASSSYDRSIKVWELGTDNSTCKESKVHVEGHDDRVSGLMYAPGGGGNGGGLLLSCSHDGTARVHSHSGSPRSEKGVQLTEAEGTRGGWRVMRGHLGEVMSSCWVDEGDECGRGGMVATASTDRRVRLWRLSAEGR